MVLSGLGVLLLLAAVYGLACCLALPVTATSDGYVSAASSDSLPALFALCVGAVIFFEGITHAERVRCRKCGSVWTPPHYRSPHITNRT